MFKKCTLSRRKAHFEVNMHQAPQPRSTLGSWDVQKVYAVVARRPFRSQNSQTPHVRATFRRWSVVLCGRCKGFCTLAFPKTMAGALQERFSSEMLGGQAADFLRGAAFWSIQIFIRFAKMILRDRCSTSYDLASLLLGRRSTLDRWSGKKCKTRWHEVVSSAVNFPFVFDVANFGNWGSVGELLRFWRYQCQKLRKSRAIASFFMLSPSKMEKVSQNSFLFKLADRQMDG